MQVSWIDETDVTALLGRLREPAKSAPPAEDDFGGAGTLFDEPDEPELKPYRLPVVAPQVIAEPEPHADLNDFRSRLQAIRERALGAGLLSRVETIEAVAEEEVPEPIAEEEPPLPIAEEAPPAPVSPAWPRFMPDGNYVSERLESFVAWAQPLLGQSEVFIIDDQGDMLHGQSDYRGLVQSTVMAWVASARMSAVFAFDRAPMLRRSMATGGHLLAIPCPTRLGLLHLAITSVQPLPDEHLPELRHALISAMEAQD